MLFSHGGDFISLEIVMANTLNGCPIIAFKFKTAKDIIIINLKTKNNLGISYSKYYK